MRYEELLEHFRANGAKIDVRSDREAFISSPLRSDSSPSVHVTKRSDGVMLMKDFGDSDPDAVKNILAAVGLSMKDLYNDGITPGHTGKKDWRSYAESYVNRPEDKGLKLADVYHYTDINTGEYAYTKLRYVFTKEYRNNLPGDKTMRFGRLENDKFTFSSSRSNAVQIDRTSAAYGDITAIKKAIANRETVYYTEGEKDVNTVFSFGFPAFTIGSSDDVTKYSSVITTLAKDADLIILADNDEPGLTSAYEVMKACQKTAKTVKIVVPDKEREHADITDYFTELHKTKAEFEELVRTADDTAVIAEYVQKVKEKKTSTPPEKPEEPKPDEGDVDKKLDAYEVGKLKYKHITPHTAEEIAGKDFEPLKMPVHGMITEGLSIIGAPPKYGKSFLMLQLAQCVGSGTPFLGRETEKGSVLYFDLETSDRSMKDRIEASGRDKYKGVTFIFTEDLRNVHQDEKDKSMPLLSQGLEWVIEDQIRTIPDISLIIIDTIVRASPPMPKAKTQYQHEADYYNILHELAVKYRVAIVLVTHTRKIQTPDDPIMDISGTYGVVGTCDNVMVLTREKRMKGLAVLTVTGRDLRGFERNLEFNSESLEWIDRGETSDDDREEAELKDRYMNSDIRQAIKAIADSLEKAKSLHATEIIDMAADLNAYITSTDAKGVGLFLKKNRPRFASFDGITVSHISNGKTGSALWRIYPTWSTVKDQEAFEDQEVNKETLTSTPFDDIVDVNG